jgi:hypothetical protein
MNAHEAIMQRGWRALPFEVVRRRGEFTVRATGLAKIFPKDFTAGPTGDYFNHGYSLHDHRDAAAIFAEFLRRELGCAGTLQHVASPARGEGVHTWNFWGLQRPTISPKAAKAESVTLGPSAQQAQRSCEGFERPSGRREGEFRSGTETLGAS